MATSFVAVDGKWKQVVSPYVATGGSWKSVPVAYVAVGGNWKSGHTGAPKVNMLLALRDTEAPWTRVLAKWSVTGSWERLETRLVHYTGGHAGLDEVVHVTDRMLEGTASLNLWKTHKLWPDHTYGIKLRAIDSLGNAITLGESKVTTAAVPMIPGMTPYGHFSHQSAGVQWNKIPDADGYHCRNDNWGTQWFNNPDGNYIYYPSGLAPSTAYHFRALVQISGVNGPWTPQHIVSTHAAPYAKGTFRLHPTGASETYQSGGSQGAKWQGSSRDLFYAGNGSTWESTRGTQRTCFFYGGDDGWNKVVDAVNKGGTITGARLYIHRQGSEGYNSGVPAVVALHSTSKPGAPGNYSGNVVTGSFAQNTAGWVGFSADWVWHLVTGRCSGVMLGDSSSGSHYMSMNKGSGLLDVDIA